MPTCIICLSEAVQRDNNSKEPLADLCDGKDCANLVKELDVIFILRNILNIPSSICEEFLTKYGSPSKWEINLCRFCQVLVGETQFVFTRIKKLVKDYDELRGALKGRFVFGDVDVKNEEQSRPSTSKYKKKAEHIEYSLPSRARQYFQQNGQKDTKAELSRPQSPSPSPASVPPAQVSKPSKTKQKKALEIKKSANIRVGRKRKQKASAVRKVGRPKSRKRIKKSVESESITENCFVKEVKSLAFEGMNNLTLKVEPMDQDENNKEDYVSDCDPIDFGEGVEMFADEHEETNDDSVNLVLDTTQDESQEYSTPGRTLRARKIKNILEKDDDESDSEMVTGQTNNDAEEMDDWNPDESEESDEEGQEDEEGPADDNCDISDADPEYVAEKSSSSIVRKKGRRKRVRIVNDVVSAVTGKTLQRCPFCSSTMQTALSLEAHILRVHKGLKKPFPCDLCKETFVKLTTVLSHIDFRHHAKIKNSEEVNLQDPNPDPEDRPNFLKDRPSSDEKFFSIFEVREADETETNEPEPPEVLVAQKKDNPLECTYCNYTFSAPWLLKAHTLRCHKGDRQPFQCDLCSKRFPTHKKVSLHRDMFHPHCTTPYQGSEKTSLEERIAELGKMQSCSKIIVDPKKIYRCKLCDINFNNRVVSEVHLRRMHEGVDSKVSCTKCDIQFLTRQGLKTHTEQKHSSKAHVKRKLLSCDECNPSLTFQTKGNYEIHLRRVHGKDKELLCEICSTSFVDRINLELHQKQVHHKELGLKPISCKICGRVLYSQRMLRFHTIQAHTKKYPFPCSRCERGFPAEFQLNRHFNVVHLKQKNHVCTFENCGKRFGLRSALDTHFRIHTGEKPYKCGDCGKEYSDKPTFRRHLETHGSKIHICDVCAKEFKVWHAFRIHRKTHDGTAPYATERVLSRTGKVKAKTNNRSKTWNNYDSSVSSPPTSQSSYNQMVVEDSKPDINPQSQEWTTIFDPSLFPQIQPPPQPPAVVSINLSMPKINFS